MKVAQQIKMSEHGHCRVIDITPIPRHQCAVNIPRLIHCSLNLSHSQIAEITRKVKFIWDRISSQTAGKGVRNIAVTDCD
jgi:hypothetical protein